MTTNNQHINNGIADIANLTLCNIAIQRAMERPVGLPGMVCLYGPSGFGKSVAANYVANLHRAHYVQAKSVWTKKHTLVSILHEMGIKPASTIPEMMEQAAQELAVSGRPLIIDEMDHIVEKNAVELIRDLYEASQAPILLIGEEQLPSKLERWERFHGRVLSWIPAQPVSIEDAHKLRHLYAREIHIEDDLLARLVELSGGSVRRVAVNMELIQETAISNGWETVDLRTWGKTELYTGKAPKRRLNRG